MAAEREVTFTDLERAVERRDPQFAELVMRFVDQGDPPPGQPELPPETDGADATEPTPPPKPPRDAWTIDRLRQALYPGTLASKTAGERKAARREAWEAIAAAPNPPPRLALGRMLIELYERDEEQWRASLIEIFRRVRLGWGAWQAFKRVYKLAEQRHDAAMFGLLAWRLDGLSSSDVLAGEIQPGTLIYMRRRAWRYLRQLGQAVPELFVQFAVEVLKHYPDTPYAFSRSWVANQVWGHKDLIGQTSSHFRGPPKDLGKRAFNEAWKISPEPLFRLIEDARNNAVCDFGIRCLQKDFAEALRQVSPSWLARIGRKRLAAVDDFIIKLLTDIPEFHQSKLRDLGLHQMVLDLLRSSSAAANKYAVDYARAHAPDIAVSDLVELVQSSNKEVRDFAAARLEQKAPKELGLAVLARLVGIDAASKLARDKFKAFGADEIDQEIHLVLALGNRTQRQFIDELFKSAKRKVPASYLCKLLDHPRCDHAARRAALEQLGKRDGAEIGQQWFKTALLDDKLRSTVGGWLRRGMLAGEALDVEWVKGLTMRPRLRELALELLGNRKLVSAARIGLPWLLAMARQADESLHQFAHRYLLENFSPEDFASDARSEADRVEAGIERLWALACGKDEPEEVRRFASLYLRVHHPQLGPTLKETRSLGIKPKLPRESYTLQRVRPLLADDRGDVRRLAAAIAAEELVRWDEVSLLYQLADSAHRETRAAGVSALLGIGEPEADPKRIPSVEWLLAPSVFALAESTHKATREVALTLIRRHYQRIGGAERLAWLMESPDRDVRLFAARLLWERHRPLGTARGWTPARGDGYGPANGARRFDSTEALRQFMRTVLFGLPPGRMERRELADGALPDRPLPASVAKQRLLGVVRDLSLEDGGFAALSVPVLEEFMHSQAKGEWQGCVAALAAIRQAHPQQPTTLPPPVAVQGRRQRPEPVGS